MDKYYHTSALFASFVYQIVCYLFRDLFYKQIYSSCMLSDPQAEAPAYMGVE
jgi:hypothetical protein